MTGLTVKCSQGKRFSTPFCYIKKMEEKQVMLHVSWVNLESYLTFLVSEAKLFSVLHRKSFHVGVELLHQLL